MVITTEGTTTDELGNEVENCQVLGEYDTKNQREAIDIAYDYWKENFPDRTKYKAVRIYGYTS